MPRIVDEAIDYLSERETHLPPLIAVLALVGLGRMARFGALGMAALWVAGHMRSIDRTRARLTAKEKADQDVDTAMEDSFPASDAPGFSPTTSGAPDEVVTVARLRTVH